MGVAPGAARGLAAAVVLLAIGAWVTAPPAPAWLGVVLDDATTATGPAVRIARVLPASPAERAGLHPGDMVLQVGGRRIGRAHEMIATVKRRRPGTILALAVERGGAPQTVETVLAARPADVYPLLEEERDPWQDPERVLDLAGVGPGSRVADLGAGRGYFTAHLAARAGAGGRVVAVEIDPEAIAALTGRFSEAVFPQVSVRRGTARDPRLEPDAFDAVLMVDTYHELEDAGAILAAVRRALRPGGRLVVVDHPAAARDPEAHAIPEADVIAEAEAAGFTLREQARLARQFVLVLEAPAAGPTPPP